MKSLKFLSSVVVALALVFSACNKDLVEPDGFDEDVATKSLISWGKAEVTPINAAILKEAMKEGVTEFATRIGKKSVVSFNSGDVTIERSILGKFTIKFAPTLEDGGVLTLYIKSLGGKYYQCIFNAKDFKGTTYVFPILSDMVIFYHPKNAFVPASGVCEDQITVTFLACDKSSVVVEDVISLCELDGPCVPIGDVWDVLTTFEGGAYNDPVAAKDLWGFDPSTMLWGDNPIWQYSIDGGDTWETLAVMWGQFEIPDVCSDILITPGWEPKKGPWTVRMIDFKGEVIGEIVRNDGDELDADAWGELCGKSGGVYGDYLKNLKIPDGYEEVPYDKDAEIDDIEIYGGWWVFNQGEAPVGPGIDGNIMALLHYYHVHTPYYVTQDIDVRLHIREIDLLKDTRLDDVKTCSFKFGTKTFEYQFASKNIEYKIVNGKFIVRVTVKYTETWSVSGPKSLTEVVEFDCGSALAGGKWNGTVTKELNDFLKVEVHLTGGHALGGAFNLSHYDAYVHVVK